MFESYIKVLAKLSLDCFDSITDSLVILTRDPHSVVLNLD